MRTEGVVGVVLLIFGLGTLLLGSMFCVELLNNLIDGSGQKLLPVEVSRFPAEKWIGEV